MSTSLCSGSMRHVQPFTSARPSNRRITSARGQILCAKVEGGDTVLVAGATGGVGQLLTAKLLDRGYGVKALVRNAERAKEVLGEQPKLQVAEADLRNSQGLDAVLEGVDAVCWVIGTTAFPSARWKGGNGPEETDLVSFRNLLRVMPKSLKRVVFTSSAGVERAGSFPYSILNLFGVLKFKRQAEELLVQSGLPHVLVRPGRLMDGPYTSYDLNTLLKKTSGQKQDVQLSAEDDQRGEASRIAVAEAVVQLLSADDVEGRKFSITSTEGGDGPQQDSEKWRKLFKSVY